MNYQEANEFLDALAKEVTKLGVDLKKVDGLQGMQQTLVWQELEDNPNWEVKKEALYGSDFNPEPGPEATQYRVGRTLARGQILLRLDYQEGFYATAIEKGKLHVTGGLPDFHSSDAQAQLPDSWLTPGRYLPTVAKAVVSRALPGALRAFAIWKELHLEQLEYEDRLWQTANKAIGSLEGPKFYREGEYAANGWQKYHNEIELPKHWVSLPSYVRGIVVYDGTVNFNQLQVTPEIANQIFKLLEKKP